MPADEFISAKRGESSSKGDQRSKSLGGKYYQSLVEATQEYMSRVNKVSGRSSAAGTETPINVEELSDTDPPPSAHLPTRKRGSSSTASEPIPIPTPAPADPHRDNSGTSSITNKVVIPEKQPLQGGKANDKTSSSLETSLEDDTRAAIISINTMDLIDAPLPLHIGEFNPRPIVQTGVRDLANEFMSENFAPFKQESMIPILLNPEDIDSSCINKDITLGSKAPRLVLSEIGKQQKQITACGGNHRRKAVLHVLGALDKKLKSLSERLEAKQTGPTKEKPKVKGKGKAAGKGKGKEVETEESDDDEADELLLDGATVTSIQKDIDEINAKKATVKMWGVIVYNASKCDVFCCAGCASHFTTN